MKILKDESQNKELVENGFVVVDCFAEEEIDGFHEQIREQGFISGAQKGEVEFYSNNLSGDDRKRLFDLLYPCSSKICQKILINQKPSLANIFQKRSGGMTRMHFHPSHVDEAKEVSLTAWLPMEDTLRMENSLGVIPGSHRVTSKIRPYNYFPQANYDSKLIKKYGRLLELKKGQAVVFFDSMLHWSPKMSKGSNKIRTALMFMFVPTNLEKLQYLFPDEKDISEINQFEIDIEELFYLSWYQSPEKPISAKIKTDISIYEESRFLESIGNEFEKLGLKPNKSRNIFSSLFRF
jgi:hypothetical protein